MELAYLPVLCPVHLSGFSLAGEVPCSDSEGAAQECIETFLGLGELDGSVG